MGPWEAVQEKKGKLREVGQDIIEDIKETKAKVREKMDAIIEVCVYVPCGRSMLLMLVLLLNLN